MVAGRAAWGDVGGDPIVIPFPEKKYQIIYADPCWQYDTTECLAKTSILDGDINTHYGTMTTDEIKSLPVIEIADDNSLLFMWVVSPMLPDALDVMGAWGFEYATVGFVWYKHKANPGHYTLSECELCLIGKRGRIPEPRGARNIRQFLSRERGKHSKKPAEIRYRIGEMFPNSDRIELFSRDKIEGRDCWGNQIPDSEQKLLRTDEVTI
jgi:N6-adenosine-specific RNA methylase IME4